MSAVVAVFPSGSLVSYEVSESLLQDKYVRILMGISSHCAHGDRTDPFSFNIVILDAPHMLRDSESTWEEFWRGLPVQPTHLVLTNDMAVGWADRMRNSNIWNDGLKIMAPPTAINDIAFNKMKTYTLWPDISPRLFPNDDVKQWYVKPAVGHSSIGCRYIDKAEAALLSKDEDLVVCEGLDESTPEYTVECYGSELIGARVREHTSGGLSIRTRASEGITPGIEHIFQRLREFMTGYEAPWFFQVKADRLLELQPRIPGAGASYRLLFGKNVLLRWVRGLGPEPEGTELVPVKSIVKVFSNRVELGEHFQPKGVAVDWDDTLRLGHRSVRHELIGALYLLRDQLPLVLVTKHSGDLLQSLENCGVSPGLFNEVIQVKHSKVDETSLHQYLLIDDSATERSLWKSWATCPVSAVPILMAMAKRETLSDEEKNEARKTSFSTQQLPGNTDAKWHLIHKPTVFDKMQLSRLRMHVDQCRRRIWDETKHEVRIMLDVGTDIYAPWQQTDGVQVESLDLPGAGPASVRGDLTKYVPGSDGRYDLVLCTEVMEHTLEPWRVPETLWKLVRFGGYVLVTVPFNFRLHGPQPDGYRFSPEGVRAMFRPWFHEVLFIQVLGTPNSPLSPCHVAVAFRKESATGSPMIPWALEKGTTGIVESVKACQFSNNGPLVRRLEAAWLDRMGLSEEEFEAVSCCNGTIGLNALAALYDDNVDQWYVQANTFWSDIQNTLRDARVLPMRSDGLCGPEISSGIERKRCGLVVTSVFGMMSDETQKYYLNAQMGAILFDHACTCAPNRCLIGDGAMFSLHETKPLGRGEGGILVVPKAFGAKLRGLLSFGAPARKSTNGKMSDVQAHSILGWWEHWDNSVRGPYWEQVKRIKILVDNCPNASWMFEKEMEDPTVIPANIALVLEHEYDMDLLQRCTKLPLRRYYQPIDEDQPHTYSLSLVIPVQPFVPIEEYKIVLDSVVDCVLPAKEAV